MTNQPRDYMQQLDDTLAEIDYKGQELRALSDRLHWLKERAAEYFERMRREQDELGVMPERQAAVFLRLADDADLAFERLSRQRRDRNLPHIKFGQCIYYTKDQLREICEIMEIRKAGRASGNKHLPRAAIKKSK